MLRESLTRDKLEVIMRRKEERTTVGWTADAKAKRVGMSMENHEELFPSERLSRVGLIKSIVF
jgi:hypothetical protein